MIFINKKISTLVIALSILLIGGFVAAQVIPRPQVSYSYAKQKLNIDQMADASKLIVFGKPTGKTDSMKVDNAVTFIFTEIEVISVIKGAAKEGEIFTILQTEDIPIDIKLDQDMVYILFVEPYIPGIKKAVGSYVITQANQGIYRIGKNMDLFEYDLEGKEQSQGERIEKIKNKFQNELSTYRVKIQK